MILSHVVYDGQFSFVTICKVGKCMMPSVLKICSDFKSCVVYSSLKRKTLQKKKGKDILNKTYFIALCELLIRGTTQRHFGHNWTFFESV